MSSTASTAKPTAQPPSTLASTTLLLNALARHQGAARGIRAEDLAARLGVNTRQLRKLISSAREDGIAICGRPKTGYFMPVTPDELAATCAFLQNRAMHSLRKLSRMRGVAMPVLMGQLLLAQG
jgi:biotin operon repressor